MAYPDHCEQQEQQKQQEQQEQSGQQTLQNGPVQADGPALQTLQHNQEQTGVQPLPDQLDQQPAPDSRWRRWAGWTSNVCLIAAVLIAAGVLLDGFVLRRAAVGTCPFVLSRPWIMAAVILSVLSLILSLFERKKPG